MLRADFAHSGCSCAVDKEGDDFYFNPLSCPLPAAPSLQMFCMYGTNNPTERAYHYQTLKTAKVRLLICPRAGSYVSSTITHY